MTIPNNAFGKYLLPVFLFMLAAGGTVGAAGNYLANDEKLTSVACFLAGVGAFGIFAFYYCFHIIRKQDANRRTS